MRIVDEVGLAGLDKEFVDHPVCSDLGAPAISEVLKHINAHTVNVFHLLFLLHEHLLFLIFFHVHSVNLDQLKSHVS